MRAETAKRHATGSLNASALEPHTVRFLAAVGADDLRPRITVRFNPRMRTRAGTCAYARIRPDHVPREFAVDLNPTLLLERHPEQLLPTLAHELAHVVVRARCGGRVAPHGPEWRQTIQRMGYPPERCHNLDVDGLERRRDGESRWVCGKCRKLVTLGPVQTRRERRRRGTYVCLCGGPLAARPADYQLPLF